MWHDSSSSPCSSQPFFWLFRVALFLGSPGIGVPAYRKNTNKDETFNAPGEDPSLGPAGSSWLGSSRLLLDPPGEASWVLLTPREPSWLSLTLTFPLTNQEA
jgi:hypothetical protein